MVAKGSKLSEETRQKIREARARQVIIHSDETKRKIALAHIGKKASPETIQRLRDSHKGKKQSSELIEKRVKSLRGRPAWNRGIPQTEEAKQKNREWHIGKLLPEEMKRRLSEIATGRPKSEVHIKNRMEAIIGGFWYGAIVYYDTLYCEKWTADLRERVRAYWNYQCFECGTPQDNRKLSVHHIHYNKKTCCDGSPHDMIPLCQSCHMKTNDDRKYWEQYFTELLYAISPTGKCFFTKDEMKAYLSPN
jgi:hypothetical protein